MTYRILLVEDNVQICRMIADYFSAQPDNICQLDTVQNGADGLDAARSGEYDLILLDVMLPDLDGFSICRSIRAVSDIPLLFLTARAREEDVLYGYTLGCDDYVVKPFSLATLYAKVLALLKRAKGTILLRGEPQRRISGNQHRVTGFRLQNRTAELQPHCAARQQEQNVVQPVRMKHRIRLPQQRLISDFENLHGTCLPFSFIF